MLHYGGDNRLTHYAIFISLEFESLDKYSDSEDNFIVLCVITTCILLDSNQKSERLYSSTFKTSP
jgi:hypothetical protein